MPGSHPFAVSGSPASHHIGRRGRTQDIDLRDTLDMFYLINDEDARVVAAVREITSSSRSCSRAAPTST